MGTLEVDKLDPQSGTALEIGTSGDTVTVPSGVTLTVAGALNVTGTTALADGTVNVAELDIDGATDIGEAIVDADLFVIDNGAGGTNRKTAASRLKTFILADNSIDSDMYVDGSIDLAHMSSQSVDEDNLYISNAGTNGQYLQKQSGNNGGLTWASVSSPISALNNATANELVTVGSTTTELDSETNLIYNGTILGAGADGANADLGRGIHIKNNDSGATAASNAGDLVIERNGDSGMTFLNSTSGESFINFGDSGDNDIGQIKYHHNANEMKFVTNAVERMSISGGGSVVFNETGAATDFRVETNGVTDALFVDGGNDRCHIKTSSASSSSAGWTLHGGNGVSQVVRDSGTPIEVCRVSTDGNMINFLKDGSEKGNVAVVGSTINYNTFMGSHWSQLTDNSKPTILQGTVMETIADMCVWYEGKFDVNEHNDESPKYHRESYDKPGDKNVGDTVTISHGDPGVDYTAEIVIEENNTLPKCKVSDTADSKKVYGVFLYWDDGDGNNYMNDMCVASLGAYMIRVHKDETVAIGDYLVSNGDGTAKVQADDVLRASTIGKVTSTEKVITHADSSYCVPCTLHCG